MFCEICEEVSEYLKVGQKWNEWPLGSVADVQQRGATCQNCQTISELVQTQSKSVTDIIRLTNGYSSDDLCLWHARRQSDGTIASEKIHHFLRKDDISRGISVDSAWIDISKIQRWLDFCNQTHGHKCLRTPLQSQDSALKSLLLVDIEQGCLVQLPSTTRYFALSYVWGRLTAITEARMDNIDMLCKKGSITLDSELVQLPETIRDAVRLLQRLGERYLWVDRLCIVQDDKKGKLFQVLNMDSIFMNAYCTIVAADGTDAHWGLPGVGSGSRPRHLPQRSLNFGHCSMQAVVDAGWHNSHHATRGWTFQEMFLSRRYIVFSCNTIFWQCQESAWQEDFSEERKQLGGFIPPLMTLHMKSWPDLFEWAGAIQGYSSRNLTFPRDVQTAFAGIEKSLEKAFPGGFTCGLPEFFFDIAMLWQPGSGSLLRRGQEYRTISDYPVPSWSWLGWTGETSHTISLQGTRYWTTYHESLNWLPDQYCELEPLFDWYQINPSTGNQRRIRNDHHEWRVRARELALPPDGWTRHINRDGCEFYTTASAPHIAFRYPMPTAAQLSPEPAQLYWPPYLWFRSNRAKFKISTYACGREKEVFVIDALESRSGCLRLNISDSEAAPVGQECELVAISRGRKLIDAGFGNLPSFSDELVNYSERDFRLGDVYEFYNVLWIKWEGDYAVREALGHIEKSAWERQDLEEIDVQLR